MEYSGRTSAYAHKHGPEDTDWKSVPHNAPPAISQMTVFNAQWTDCPVEVEEEVKKLWRFQEFGNDNFYYSWDRSSTMYVDLSNKLFDKNSLESKSIDYDDDDHSIEIKLSDLFPIIDEYLMSHGIERCLIHWWW